MNRQIDIEGDTMKKLLQDRLYENYPKIFQEIKRPGRGGIATGDGWYVLIDNLCKSIQRHTKLDDSMKISALQVKEKFGGLRFYYAGGNPAIKDLINMAEKMSFEICEECARPGKEHTTQSGWIRTLCNNCDKTRGEK